jgi:hypothetical protein
VAEGEATIIPFVLKLCDECQHGYLGRAGVYCIQFQEFVEPTVALDCTEFSL